MNWIYLSERRSLNPQQTFLWPQLKKSNANYDHFTQMSHRITWWHVLDGHGLRLQPELCAEATTTLVKHLIEAEAACFQRHGLVVFHRCMLQSPLLQQRHCGHGLIGFACECWCMRFTTARGLIVSTWLVLWFRTRGVENHRVFKEPGLFSSSVSVVLIPKMLTRCTHRTLDFEKLIF